MSRHNALRFLLVLILSAALILTLAACRGREPAAVVVPTPPAATRTAAPGPTVTATATAAPTTQALAVWADDAYELDDFPADAPFVLHFNQPVDAAGVDGVLQVRPALRGRVSWNRALTRLTFRPEAGFDPGRAYTLSLNPELQSAAGERVAAGQRNWRIQTQEAPRVLDRSPGSRVVDERRPTITLSFSRPMEADSVAAALHVEPELAYSLAWEGSTLRITAQEPLAFATDYAFTLDETATDREGRRLSRPYHWSLRLQDLVRRVTGPTKAHPEAVIRLTFNYALAPQRFADTFSIEPDAAGELAWSDDHTIFTFTPESRLRAGTGYTIAFGGPLQGDDGDELPAPEPIHFTTPPPILQALPEGGGADPAGSISVRFDRPMDEAATAAAFAVDPDVPGTITWQETTLVFRPDGGYFAENTTYNVSVGSGARGAGGEAILDHAYAWSFSTRELGNLASFGWGPNAQVLDASGPRAIQFTAEARAVTLGFDLYRLSLAQFLDRYASGFRGAAGWQEEELPPISTVGTTLVESWTAETAEGAWQETVVPPAVPPGLYILDVTAGDVDDQLILIISDNTLAVKQAEEQLVVWVTDINGAVVPGVEVSVYARSGALLDRGTADGNGLYRTTLPAYEAGGPPSMEPLIVVARDGEDLTVSGLAPEWRSDGRWWGWWLPAPAAQDYAAYIYTDRPIYKPGQRVSFKAILRRDDDAVLSMLPAGTPVIARLRDARDNVVQTLELASSHFGSVDGSFAIAAGAMLGTYRVEIVVDGESHSQAFKVEDYRKPDYEVTVTTDAGRYAEGDSVAITVEARYFFGEPVANAEISLQRFTLLPNYGWSDEPGDAIWYQSGEGAVRGRTGEDGRFTTTWQVEDVEDGYYGNYRGSIVEQSGWAFEATVVDGSNQTASGFAPLQVYSAAALVEVDTHGYVHEPGQPFAVDAHVTTIFGEPVAAKTLTLQLLRWSRSSYDYDTVVQEAALTTDGNGRAHLLFTPEEPGYYQLSVAGRDERGNLIGYESGLYVFSDFYGSWFGRGDGGLSISADRDSYAPGDTAQLLVESGFSGPALLTFERGTTRREQLVELTEPVTMVPVAIEADDVPNIYVSVNAWHEPEQAAEEMQDVSRPDSRLHRASANLSVPATSKALDVAITPDRDVYAPRDEATFTVRVTNHAGVPVSAEVTLALVDEAIFALSEELAGPIFDAFYFERENTVRTYDSLSLLRYLWGGGGGGGGGLAPGGPRSDFPDTAAWFPSLSTDANGEATVTVTLPDSLTTWRLTAKAATADTQVGEAQRTVLVRQDVVVRPLLPRTLTAGDTVQLSAVVHNYSGETQTFAVSIKEIRDQRLEIGGAVTQTATLGRDALREIGDWRLEIGGVVTQTVTLGADELRVVGWQARVVEAGDATIQVMALPEAEDVFGDAVVMTIPVRPLAVPDVATQVGAFAGQFATTIEVPAAALPMSQVEIQLSRSIAGSLLQGLDYLTGFPYGCVEQTMSKALPNAVVGRALHQLGVTNPTLQADLPPKINASLQRLYGFQHNDGGWGWWYDDPSYDYQTAWVVFGLAMTAEAGYEVDRGVIERGVQWLAEHLPQMDARTRAFALYSMALAEQVSPSLNSGQVRQEALALRAQEDDLDTFSRAALALALQRLGETAAAGSIVDALAETAVVAENGAYWRGENYDGAYYQKTMASMTRSTALALSAFSTIRPGHELEGKIVAWLMAQRRQQGWGTTNETSFAIGGLVDHLVAVNAAGGATSTTYEVHLNGATLAGGSLGPGEPAVSLVIPRQELQDGTNDLVISQGGSGRLYYVINRRVYVAQTEIDAAGIVQVTRTYRDPQTHQPLQTIAPGQLVEVELVVHLPQEGSYLIVEDNLPGGLEALNERLNTTSHVAVAYGEEPAYAWERYGYNYKEVFGDRVSFFVTELGAGRHTYTYLARANHSGAFTARPAELYGMYNLALWGRSGSDSLVITAE